MDPRTLGLNPSFNALFEADFGGEGRRPRDGNGSGTAEFDPGALESGQAARPSITNLNPNTGVHGQTITLTVTGERLGGATARLACPLPLRRRGMDAGWASRV